ncbi:MAG: hypothetical protein Q9M16_04375 [Mariprofundus sp.]|nr:hypothetical protein [Mariprofundus sp.]
MPRTAAYTEESATTIDGLIVDMLADLSEARLCLQINGIHVEVLSLRGDSIQRVLLSPATKQG